MTERCAAGPDCVGWIVTEGQRIPAALDDTGPLCGPCKGATRTAAKALPLAYYELHSLIGEPQTAMLGARVSGTPAPPILINTSVEALQRLIVETAERAAELVAEKLNVEMVSRRAGWPIHRGPALNKACNLIEHNVELLITMPTIAHTIWIGDRRWVKYLDGADIACQLIRLHRLARRHLGQTIPAQRQDIPCPHCQQKALVREVRDLRGTRSSSKPGDTTPEVVSCRNCGNEWTECEWRWLQNLILTEAQEKEIDMLQWLYCEAQWKLEQAEKKLAKVEAMSNLQPEEFPNDVLLQGLREILTGQLINA